MPSDLRELVLKIHGTPHKAVMAITGGGAEAIGELLRHGQGSNTLLEAVVPYDQKAFNDFVKGIPDKYCSPGAARDLAMAAFQRASRLNGSSENIVGIGASCSLMKDNERAGREHHAYIAIQTPRSTATYTLETADLHVDGPTRNSQERFVAEAIIKSLGNACGVAEYATPDTTVANDEQFAVISGLKPFISFDPFNKVYQNLPVGGRVIFPGAFNPWHEGHDQIVSKVQELTGKPVDLEITVRNADKPALNYTDMLIRLANVSGVVENKPWRGYIHLSGLTTFAEKARAFPDSTFVMGWDTFRRINDPKYGDLKTVSDVLYQNGARFMVFHRIIDGKSTHEERSEIYPPLMSITHVISPDVLPPSDLSSSQIRKKNG